MTLAGDSERSFVYDINGRINWTKVKNLSDNGFYGQVRTTTFSYTRHAALDLVYRLKRLG